MAQKVSSDISSVVKRTPNRVSYILRDDSRYTMYEMETTVESKYLMTHEHLGVYRCIECNSTRFATVLIKNAAMMKEYHCEKCEDTLPHKLSEVRIC